MDYRRELSELCKLILERKSEEELSTHVVASFLDEDATVIVQRAEFIQQRLHREAVAGGIIREALLSKPGGE